MGQTIAEALREEGMIEGERKGELKGKLKAKRETLIMLLRKKFGKKVTPAITANVQRTSDLDTLDEWIAKVLDAEGLEELRISVRKR